MSELRKDPVSRRWVIFAPERGFRPSQFEKHDLNSYINSISHCPFCEGNEKANDAEIFVYEKVPGRKPNESGWWIRVLQNKYPALKDEPTLGKVGVGIYDKMNGVGIHEIVVETPKHCKCISELSYSEIEKIFQAYIDRYIEIKKDENMKYILIFKNHGRDAGASLEHTHSQIIATPVIPKRVETELSGAKLYYEFRDRCVFCDIVTQEMESKERLVVENEEFISFVFFAGRFPYETWILPKKHISSIEKLKKKKIKLLARILKDTLVKLKTVLNNPDYNFVIHNVPLDNFGDHYYHFHIEIIPKITKVAGFEWGTGFYINPVLPEDAAKKLKEVEIKED